MIAKNNIFNIRATEGTTWKGQVGAKDGFVEFETREMAIRAWLVLMRTYRRKHRCQTIDEIVTRFAPPTENNTSLYVRQMADWTGISRYKLLHGYTDYCLLAQAMARKETGARLRLDDVLAVMKKYDTKPF